MLALAAALLALLRPDKAIDFHVYFENARHYFAGAPMYGPSSGTGWAGGVYRYPPIFLDLFRPLAALPLRLSVVLWAAGKPLAAGALVIALRKRWGLPSVLALWPALLLLAPYFIQEIRYGNAQFYIVALVMAAFLPCDASRAPRAAPAAPPFLLGFATALKVWPLFFLPCLLFRRRWRLAGWAAAWGAAWTLLPALWRGWHAQWQLLAQWLAQERSIAALSARAGELWYPGQSLHDVLARYLRVINYSQLADASGYPQIAWLHLSPVGFERLWLTVAVVLTLALFFWLARATGSGDGVVALLFCAVMVLEPHVHRLILVALAWPALWLASEWAHGRLPRPWQFCLWLTLAAAVLEPLVPGSVRQRVMQTYGLDFWLVVLPLTIACACWAWRPNRHSLSLPGASPPPPPTGRRPLGALRFGRQLRLLADGRAGSGGAH